MAFRAALAELATDIQLLEGWQPHLQSTVPADWLRTPLAFAATRDLMALVWLPGALWDRIMTTLLGSPFRGMRCPERACGIAGARFGFMAVTAIHRACAASGSAFVPAPRRNGQD